MTMATPQKTSIPSPAYKNTIVCPYCWAEYRPGNWCVTAFPASSTTGDSEKLYKLPNNVCPICRRTVE